MSIFIKKPGILDTFQDLGRKGFRKFGINPNGAMDKTAVRLINILIGNTENETVLEMHFPAPQIQFEGDTNFLLGGADFQATLDDQPIENWKLSFAKEGQKLKFNNKINGNRVYLSVKGGFKLEKWLGSSSTNLVAKVGGFEGRNLKRGDKILFKNTFHSKTKSQPKISNSLIPRYSKFPTVRIIAGAEFIKLTALSLREFLSGKFSISNNSNRMGFRLTGKTLHLLSKEDLISSAVNFGTIQLLPNGQLIILMADHQTTGGYPRMANVFEQDLSLLGQLGTGDGVGFHLISGEEAEELNLKFEKEISLLKVGLKLNK